MAYSNEEDINTEREENVDYLLEQRRHNIAENKRSYIAALM